MLIGARESGFDPYAINVDGFDLKPRSFEEAAQLVLDAHRANARNVDVGCGQVSLRHHPEAFRSLGEAFDPEINADRAATILVEARRRGGSWTAAMQLYHSSDPARAKAYLCAVWKGGGRALLGDEADRQMRSYCR